MNIFKLREKTLISISDFSEKSFLLLIPCLIVFGLVYLFFAIAIRISMSFPSERKADKSYLDIYYRAGKSDEIPKRRRFWKEKFKKSGLRRPAYIRVLSGALAAAFAFMLIPAEIITVFADEPDINDINHSYWLDKYGEEFDAYATKYTSIPDYAIEQYVLVDYSNVSSTAINQTLIVASSVEIIKFKGLSQKFTELNIIIEGNTEVVFDDFNYVGGESDPALDFYGESPTFVSIGDSNSIEGRGNFDALRANGNLSIIGNANLTVKHVTTTGNGITGKSAISVFNSLSIDMVDAALSAIGGNGQIGKNGDNGKNGGAGGAGGSGISAGEVRILNSSLVNATGGNGGNGGNGLTGSNGAQGTIGSKAPSGGKGGNGGDGGNGGTAVITTTNFDNSPFSDVTFKAGQGGKGGNGGKGGKGGGAAGVIFGIAGDGGNGGVGGDGGYGGYHGHLYSDGGISFGVNSSSGFTYGASTGTAGAGGSGGSGYRNGSTGSRGKDAASNPPKTRQQLSDLNYLTEKISGICINSINATDIGGNTVTRFAPNQEILISINVKTEENLLETWLNEIYANCFDNEGNVDKDAPIKLFSGVDVAVYNGLIKPDTRIEKLNGMM